MRLKYFSPQEFEHCSPSCDVSQMNEDFLSKLDEARSNSIFPWILSSAYRSPEWDKKKGRSGSGYHTKGRAVDIRCSDSMLRAEILRCCLSVGLSCGVSKTFIHVDDRDFRDSLFPIVFLY